MSKNIPKDDAVQILLDELDKWNKLWFAALQVYENNNSNIPEDMLREVKLVSGVIKKIMKEIEKL